MGEVSVEAVLLSLYTLGCLAALLILRRVPPGWFDDEEWVFRLPDGGTPFTKHLKDAAWARDSIVRVDLLFLWPAMPLVYAVYFGWLAVGWLFFLLSCMVSPPKGLK